MIDKLLERAVFRIEMGLPINKKNCTEEAYSLLVDIFIEEILDEMLDSSIDIAAHRAMSELKYNNYNELYEVREDK